MMRPMIVLACAAALTACIARPGGRDNELARSPVWTVALSPTDGGTVHGNATLVAEEGSNAIRAVITLEGSRNGAMHPWDIHTGRCGTDGGNHGAVVGKSRIYPPIPIGGAGAATMSLELPIQLLSRSEYYLNVHDSMARRHIVACGALVRDRGPLAHAGAR